MGLRKMSDRTTSGFAKQPRHVNAAFGLEGANSGARLSGQHFGQGTIQSSSPRRLFKAGEFHSSYAGAPMKLRIGRLTSGLLFLVLPMAAQVETRTGPNGSTGQNAPTVLQVIGGTGGSGGSGFASGAG